MDLPGIVIDDNDKITDVEGIAISDICISLTDEFSVYNSNELKYYTNIFLDFPKEVGEPIERNVDFVMKRDIQTNVIYGAIDNFACIYIQLFKCEICIKPTGELEGHIEIIYNNVRFTGDITGKTLTGGFSAMFTCFSVLHSDDNSIKFDLNFNCINDITSKCSASGICNKISELLGNTNVLHYDKYIAGWKKIGQAYRYISPETHSTLKYDESTTFSTDVLKAILKCIDNDLGMLTFAHCLQSIVMSMMKSADHSILNIECSTYDGEKQKDYISSIVHSFWKPEITVNNRNVSNFALNRKFKVSSCMPNKIKLKRDSRLFKDFPVFLYGEYIKRNIYSNAPEPLPSIKPKIAEADIRHMLKSDLSFICFNADNHIPGIIRFNIDKPVELTDMTLINNNLYILIREYIAFLEKRISRNINLSPKNIKLIELYNEIFYEFKFCIFKYFLSELKEKIKKLAKNISQQNEFIILCRHINYSDVINLYRNVMQISESYRDTSDFIDRNKMNKNFDIFKCDIVKRSEKKLNNTDFRYLERAEICSKYLEKLNYDLECDFCKTILEEDYDSLINNLKRKFKLYLKQYRERLIIKFAGSMEYDVEQFKEWSDYAKKTMNKHKQECTKPTRKYCEGLLAAAYGFTVFLRERYSLEDNMCESMLQRVENIHQYLYSYDEVKPLNEELKVKIFCTFLDSCRKMSADTISLKKSLNPIYTEEKLQHINDENKKDTVQPIGWYDVDKFEYLMIKTDKANPLMKHPPVETAFKNYLSEKGYESDFVWTTFVSKQLYPRKLVRGTKIPRKKSSRYDYKKTVDGNKYTVYYMYL